MNAIAPTLIQKLQELPPQRLGESLSKLDALNLPPLSDDEINAEIQAARQERNTQHN